MVGAGHGRGMASVNQTRPRCVNQIGKTHSKPLAARHGRGTAWARHAMCESALKVHLQTFLSVPVTQKCQILSCDTLVANKRYGLHLHGSQHNDKSIGKMSSYVRLYLSVLVRASIIPYAITDIFKIFLRMCCGL
jgi:hypothetical protein